MPIPERLKLQPVDKKLLDEMSLLCDSIERELEACGTAHDLMERWHAHARRRYGPYEFQTYWRARSRECFVLEALNPEASFDSNVDYSEALAVLEAVSAAAVPEGEITYYLGWLEAQFPAANVNDLIYWPDEWFGDATLFRGADGAFKPESELTADRILGYAMAKSGRRLPGGPMDVTLPFPMPRAK